MKNKVVFFEIPASNFKQAKEFYEQVFDRKVDLCGDDGAMAYKTPADKDQNPIEPGGINGGFHKRKSNHDQPSFVVETGDIDKTLAAIEKAGGKVKTPKHAIGEWGFMADFADPEGNVIALWEKAAGSGDSQEGCRLLGRVSRRQGARLPPLIPSPFPRRHRMGIRPQPEACSSCSSL